MSQESRRIQNPGWRLEQGYAALPSILHTAVFPTPVASPSLVILNTPLALSLGLDAQALASRDAVEVLAGNRLPEGAAPLAQAYSGHQYGHFTTLGDGRAILLGEQVTTSGQRWDIQLKGSGPTPYSRRGDGRAALGPMLREYVIGEAMHALNIPTTRALAVVTTGETVWRQTALPGAVLTRVAASHIRVGTFQFAAAQGDLATLRALTEYTLQRHFPERVGRQNAALALLEGVVQRQASLIAQWMLVGFVHGVMNTDNMALSGETIDYGPCAFMDAYDPATVFSSIDRHGRYAYGNQPAIAQWNLTRFAEALLPVLDPEHDAAVRMATDVLEGFGSLFQATLLAGFRSKLGLFNEDAEDLALIEGLLAWMRDTQADFTNTFAGLSDFTPAVGGDSVFSAWQSQWQARLTRQPQARDESVLLQRRANPSVIPRNHLVEAALAEAERGDLAPLEGLLRVITRPFDHGVHPREYLEAARPGELPYQTFCGT